MSGRVGSITTGIITDGLVFNMDAANRASYPRTGTTVTNTVSSLTGTINGASFETIDNGIFSFDGTDDYINCGNDTSLHPSNFTVCLWVKPLNYGSKTLIHNGAGQWGSSTTGFYIAESYANYYFKIGNGTTTHTVFNGGLVRNTWQFITLSYDGVNMKTYLDTVLQDTLAVSNITYSTVVAYNPFFIGRTSAGASFFDGNLGPVQVYNRALSSSEVLHNYNALAGRFGL